jgi:hypothetical protein
MPQIRLRVLAHEGVTQNRAINKPTSPRNKPRNKEQKHKARGKQLRWNYLSGADYPPWYRGLSAWVSWTDHEQGADHPKLPPVNRTFTRKLTGADRPFTTRGQFASPRTIRLSLADRPTNHFQTKTKSLTNRMTRLKKSWRTRDEQRGCELSTTTTRTVRPSRRTQLEPHAKLTPTSNRRISQTTGWIEPKFWVDEKHL